MKEQRAGSREQGAGMKEQGAGSREQGAGIKAAPQEAGRGDCCSPPPALCVPDALAITSAEFITSAVQPEQYPRDESPEVAFAGRSNVGKSALINCLIQRKKLVRTSRTPGRTQLINFFKINNSFLFVDLPGYGYAKVSQSLRASWGPMIETYLDSRENLRGIVQIMDLRHPPTPDDISLWSWLKEKKLPAIPILTKADKLSRAKWNPLAQAAGRILGISPADFIIFSAQTQQGRNELLCRVKELILR